MRCAFLLPAAASTGWMTNITFGAVGMPDSAGINESVWSVEADPLAPRLAKSLQARATRGMPEVPLGYHRTRPGPSAPPTGAGAGTVALPATELLPAGQPRRHSSGVGKRLIAGPLWFFATLYAWEFLAFVLPGLPTAVGPVLAIVLASLIVLDPAELLWTAPRVGANSASRRPVGISRAAR